MEKKSLKEKVLALFGSLKFWIATLTMVTMLLEAFAGGTLTMQVFVNVIQTWLVAVFGVGVVDSIAEKIGGSRFASVISALQKQLDEIKKK